MGKSCEAINGALGFLCLVLLVGKSGAYDFVVGGQKGWTVPSDPNFNPYNTWTEKSRFQIGDSLVFNYNSGQDSVLEVKSEDYANCNTNAPIAKYTDGHTLHKFSHSGHHFFISGNRDNCLKNEKLVVVVLADRTKASNNASAPSPLASLHYNFSLPFLINGLDGLTRKKEKKINKRISFPSTLAPSPLSSAASPPTPPPSAASPPSPLPSANSSPPTPSPTTTTGTTPTPAPVSGPPPSHVNGASSVYCTFAGTVGAFMASTLVLSF